MSKEWIEDQLRVLSNESYELIEHCRVLEEHAKRFSNRLYSLMVYIQGQEDVK